MINPFDIDSEKNFGAFYNAYYKRFVRYASYYVNDLHTAEDMTHDALLYYWEHKNDYSDRSRFYRDTCDLAIQLFD